MVVLVEFISKKYPKEPYDAQKIGRVQRRKISINQHSEEIELYYGYTACDWYWKLPTRPSFYDHSFLKARRQETRMSVVKFGGVSTAGSETTKSWLHQPRKRIDFPCRKVGSLYIHYCTLTTWPQGIVKWTAQLSNPKASNKYNHCFLKKSYRCTYQRSLAGGTMYPRGRPRRI